MTSAAKNIVPDTRNSLILRLHDGRDIDAWNQFALIYEPLVYRLARSKGFQDADAQEIVQEVLVAVARAVERWEPDPERGRFRDWLFCIARNLMIQFMTRRKHRAWGTGDSAMVDFLHQQVDPISEESVEEFDLEYRREIFLWAARQVREEVTFNTWQAFWRTSVEGQSTVDVAKQLGLTVGATHIGRSRVRGRLRKIVRRLQQENEHVDVTRGSIQP